jgi:hypothetical protein
VASPVERCSANRLMRLNRGRRLELLLLGRSSAVATAAALALVALGACGSGDGDGDATSSSANAGIPCIDEDPGDAATYANADVAIGRDPRKPVGGELASDRSGGKLPWFAKTGLFVRGNREVVVRVPDELRDMVRIVGWGGTAKGESREAVLVHPITPCAQDWTAYPGGLVFRGRRCVRLRVEGPGDARGSVLVGLRKDCAA